MQTGAINEVTFYILERAVIQGLKLLFGYHSGLVRTGSDRFYKIISLHEPRTGHMVQFMPWHELWTGLRSGSQNFRFKL